MKQGNKSGSRASKVWNDFKPRLQRFVAKSNEVDALFVAQINTDLNTATCGECDAKCHTLSLLYSLGNNNMCVHLDVKFMHT